jgi:arylsulfatase A
MVGINRRQFLKMMGAATASSVLPLSCTKENNQKPNIIFILSDDHGWTQLGCYGSNYYETPNIDRLAKQGMRFTNAYAACPVCSPTRASIMTGKYPARLHITDFIKGGKPPACAKLKHPSWQKYLLLEELTIAEVLKQNGYATGFFGKYHLSREKMPPQSLPYNPDKQGFDESFVTYKPSRSMAQAWQTPENDGHNVEIITQKSLRFIEDHQDTPFFLYVSHNTIHNPLMEKKPLIQKYQNKSGSDRPENNPIVGAMLETLDKSVGSLSKKLEKLNLSDNTIVIFFSDNGGLEKEADQTPLRSGKASLYEGGIRVPFIVKWKSKVKPNTTNDEIVCSVDFFPTFLEAAGIKNSFKNIDGRSLIPILMRQQVLSREAIYWHYPHYHSAGEGPSGAIRMGDFKLIEWFEKSIDGIQTDGALELYNLKDDIGEQKNLFEEKPELAARLYKKLSDWRKNTGAQEMEKNTD